MNLLEIRTKFIELSGRVDLVVDTTDYVDAGADFFINSGCRYLDRLENVPKSVAKMFKRVEEDDWYATFNDCRAIKEVYAADDDDRWALEKKELGWLMLEYSDVLSDITSGDPKYYAPAILRQVPQGLGSVTMSQFVDEVVQTDINHMIYNGIIWMPPCDETMIMEIQGLFYSEKLEVNTDVNFWTINDPLICVFAALRALEASYRNTEGVKDWERAITSEVVGLGMDDVEGNIAGVTSIEG